MPQKLKLYIHFTKLPKRDDIYKLCLWMLEEHAQKYTLHRINQA